MFSTLLAAALAVSSAPPAPANDLPTAEDRALAAAARDFRIQTYNTFRLDRPEFNRRRAAWNKLHDQWVESGRKAEDRQRLLTWLDRATHASRPDSVGPLPEFASPEAVAAQDPPTLQRKSVAAEVDAQATTGPDGPRDTAEQPPAEATAQTTPANRQPLPAAEHDPSGTPIGDLSPPRVEGVPPVLRNAEEPLPGVATSTAAPNLGSPSNREATQPPAANSSGADTIAPPAPRVAAPGPVAAQPEILQPTQPPALHAAPSTGDSSPEPRRVVPAERSPRAQDAAGAAAAPTAPLDRTAPPRGEANPRGPSSVAAESVGPLPVEPETSVELHPSPLQDRPNQTSPPPAGNRPREAPAPESPFAPTPSPAAARALDAPQPTTSSLAPGANDPRTARVTVRGTLAVEVDHDPLAAPALPATPSPGTAPAELRRENEQPADHPTSPRDAAARPTDAAQVNQEELLARAAGYQVGLRGVESALSDERPLDAEQLAVLLSELEQLLAARRDLALYIPLADDGVQARLKDQLAFPSATIAELGNRIATARRDSNDSSATDQTPTSGAVSPLERLESLSRRLANLAETNP